MNEKQLQKYPINWFFPLTHYKTSIWRLQFQYRFTAMLISQRREKTQSLSACAQREIILRGGGGVCVCRHLKRESDEIIIADRGVSVRAARDAGTILLICPLMEKPCATWSEWCRPASGCSLLLLQRSHIERSCVRLLRSPGESLDLLLIGDRTHLFIRWTCSVARFWDGSPMQLCEFSPFDQQESFLWARLAGLFIAYTNLFIRLLWPESSFLLCFYWPHLLGWACVLSVFCYPV